MKEKEMNKNLITKIMDFYGFSFNNKPKKNKVTKLKRKIREPEVTITDRKSIQEPIIEETVEIEEEPYYEEFASTSDKIETKNETKPIIEIPIKVEQPEIIQEPIIEETVEIEEEPYYEEFASTSDKIETKNETKPIIGIPITEEKPKIILNPIKEETKKEEESYYKEFAPISFKTEPKKEMKPSVEITIDEFPVQNFAPDNVNKNSEKYIRTDKNEELFRYIVDSSHRLDRVINKSLEIDFSSELNELKNLIIKLSQIDRKNDLKSLILINDKIKILEKKILSKLFEDKIHIKSDNQHNRNIIYYNNIINMLDKKIHAIDTKKSEYVTLFQVRDELEQRIVSEIIKNREERLVFNENPFIMYKKEDDIYTGYTQEEYHKILSIMHK